MGTGQNLSPRRDQGTILNGLTFTHGPYGWSRDRATNPATSDRHLWSYITSETTRQHPFPRSYQTPPKRNHGFSSGISTFHWDHLGGVYN